MGGSTIIARPAARVEELSLPDWQRLQALEAELPAATSGPEAWLEPEDSLHAVEFVLALEEEFELEIPDEDVGELHTLPEVVTYIDRRMQQRIN